MSVLISPQGFVLHWFSTCHDVSLHRPSQNLIRCVFVNFPHIRSILKFFIHQITSDGEEKNKKNLTNLTNE